MHLSVLYRRLQQALTIRSRGSNVEFLIHADPQIPHRVVIRIAPHTAQLPLLRARSIKSKPLVGNIFKQKCQIQRKTFMKATTSMYTYTHVSITFYDTSDKSNVGCVVASSAFHRHNGTMYRTCHNQSTIHSLQFVLHMEDHIYHRAMKMGRSC